jgi:hypothetical protein
MVNRGGSMNLYDQRHRFLERMFDTALKDLMNTMARKYDYDLVFKLWTEILTTDVVKTQFSKDKWQSDMTISEAMDCLDDYYAELEALLKKRQAQKESKKRSPNNL